MNSVDHKTSSYKDVIVWQKGIALVEHVYAVSNNFPEEESKMLTSLLNKLKDESLSTSH